MWSEAETVSCELKRTDLVWRIGIVSIDSLSFRDKFEMVNNWISKNSARMIAFTLTLIVFPFSRRCDRDFQANDIQFETKNANLQSCLDRFCCAKGIFSAIFVHCVHGPD